MTVCEIYILTDQSGLEAQSIRDVIKYLFIHASIVETVRFRVRRHLLFI